MLKQKDIALLLIVTFVSVVVSIVVAKFAFGGATKHQQQVEVVPAITANFPTPSSQYFNGQSIDPTQLIQIGNTVNPTPFNTAKQ
jgi:hypothetical protein